MSMSSRDFQRAARQRLTTAEFLLQNRFTLDATYLAGYAIECSLKALILESTPLGKRIEMLGKISSGSKMHNPEVLGETLKDLGRPIPSELVKRFRRSRWSTGLRYQSGRRDTGETRAFLKTARMTLDWVQGFLP